jgi:hypothetical protein
MPDIMRTMPYKSRVRNVLSWRTALFFVVGCAVVFPVELLMSKSWSLLLLALASAVFCLLLAFQLISRKRYLIDSQDPTWIIFRTSPLYTATRLSSALLLISLVSVIGSLLGVRSFTSSYFINVPCYAMLMSVGIVYFSLPSRLELHVTKSTYIRKDLWGTGRREGPFSDFRLIRLTRWPGSRERYVCVLTLEGYRESTIFVEAAREKAIEQAEKLSGILNLPVSYQNWDLPA